MCSGLTEGKKGAHSHGQRQLSLSFPKPVQVEDPGASGSILLGARRACSSGVWAGTEKSWPDVTYASQDVPRTPSASLRAELD